MAPATYAPRHDDAPCLNALAPAQRQLVDPALPITPAQQLKELVVTWDRNQLVIKRLMGHLRHASNCLAGQVAS